ncbi:MAG: alpha/beta hydrolase [Ilumatobacteraceae bacterium]
MADGTVTLKCTPEQEALTFEGAGAFRIEHVTELEVPVLVAKGAVDQGDPPGRWAAPLAEALPRGTFVEYEHLGHFGPLQDPITVSRDIVAFATRVGAFGG